MRMFLALTLTALLTMEQVSAQQPAQDSAVKEQIAAIPAKALVEVSMRTGGTLRGHIVSRTDADFTLRQEKGGTTQTIAYDQVLSVSQIKGGHSHLKWAIIGIVIGAAVVVAIVGILVARSGY